MKMKTLIIIVAIVLSGELVFIVSSYFISIKESPVGYEGISSHKGSRKVSLKKSVKASPMNEAMVKKPETPALTSERQPEFIKTAPVENDETRDYSPEYRQDYGEPDPVEVEEDIDPEDLPPDNDFDESEFPPFDPIRNYRGPDTDIPDPEDEGSDYFSPLLPEITDDERLHGPNVPPETDPRDLPPFSPEINKIGPVRD